MIVALYTPLLSFINEWGDDRGIMHTFIIVYQRMGDERGIIHTFIIVYQRMGR